MVARSTVINSLLERFAEPRYLEIGVNKGETFFSVPLTTRKVAVDPEFLFDFAAHAADEPNSEYHQVTSDIYFADIVEPTRQFDVIYLDGLHTFDQTLRDFIHAVDHLSPSGVIVVDDVQPNSYHASLKSMEEAYGIKAWLGSDDWSWMGDVYRLVFFIQSYYSRFSLRVIEDNHGQAVIWRKPRRSTELLPLTVAETASVPFEATIFNKAAMARKPFVEILAEIGAGP